MYPLTAKRMARQLMDEYGLTNWEFKFDRAVKRFGQCLYGPKVISLSLPLTERNGEEEVKDTILHEIAHALVGPGQHHNDRWKEECVKVGARPVRCYDGMAVKQPPAKWKLTCPNCGHTTTRIRARGKGTLACTACCNKYNGGAWTELFKVEWERVVIDPRDEEGEGSG